MTIHRILFGAAIFVAALGAQSQKSVSGTVTGFKSLEIGIRTDAAEAASIRFGPETQVVTVVPGERDLSKANPAAVTDIVLGDRIMATYVAGLTEARRVVLITGRDIAKRNEAERQDWKTRGISGIVTAVNGDQILLELRTPEGAHTVTVTVDARTKIRRYAPDTVRFVDAVWSSTAEISKGDQLQTRGAKSEGDTKIAAEDVVFGTFVTKLGTITAINRETGEVQIQEVPAKQPWTIHLAAASQIKMMPDMRAMLFGAKSTDHSTAPPAQEPAGRFDLQRALEKLPAGKIDDLKVGGGVMITSTKGAKTNELTAILMLANADFFVAMAKGAANDPGGATGMEAIGKIHGGMLGGAGGISLPTMIQ
uniref:DUF5666 domain-containing protein n=1 Tax=Solibacter usitatus (strain Ellin6076) TaxID=234267 RepID=Q01R03_SOLUE